MTDNQTWFGLLKKDKGKQRLTVSLMEAKEYRGVQYWCSPDGLCELPLDCGTACGSEELLRDMIDADTGVP